MSSAGAEHETIVIKGSDTVGAKLIPLLCKRFQETEKEVTFEISAEGTSSGFQGLLDDSAHIAMASRSIRASEEQAFKSTTSEHVIALDFIALIVHESNPVTGVSLDEVRDIFTGTLTNWSQVGGTDGLISVYTRNTSSGTFRTFQKLAMDGEPYGKTIQKIAGGERIDREVKLNPLGIGYVGLAYSNGKEIKVLNVDGIPATFENRFQYPITRKLYLYLPASASSTTKRFVEWIQTSSEAFMIIKSVGFLPVSDPS